MTDEKLLQVVAYYVDSDGILQRVQAENALLAESFSSKWAQWRAAARDLMGVELLISPPSSGTYTRAMFRSPQDQAYLDAQPGVSAATVDASAHQAGHAVDLDLGSMAQLYPGYSYSKLVSSAKEFGITPRVYNLNGTEPWHFDDNPAGIYGSTYAAIAAIGNLSSQVADDIQAGLATPQAQAIITAATNAFPVVAAVAVVGLAAWIYSASRSKSPKRARAWAQ